MVLNSSNLTNQIHKEIKFTNSFEAQINNATKTYNAIKSNKYHVKLNEHYQVSQ